MNNITPIPVWAEQSTEAGECLFTSSRGAKQTRFPPFFDVSGSLPGYRQATILIAARKINVRIAVMGGFATVGFR